MFKNTKDLVYGLIFMHNIFYEKVVMIREGVFI